MIFDYVAAHVPSEIVLHPENKESLIHAIRIRPTSDDPVLLQGEVSFSPLSIDLKMLNCDAVIMFYGAWL